MPNHRPHIVVVGVGAFGGWTALHLLRRGAKVTLLDAWGPGNSRASSGGETRIIRATYGPDRVYVELVVRSLQLWREHEARWNQLFFRQTGALWLADADDSYEKSALPLLKDAGLPIEELGPAELRRRFPQINFEGVGWAILEQRAGYLLARRACAAVLDACVQEGGDYRPLAVTDVPIDGDRLAAIALSDGSRLSADGYVFACGPWLGQLFPAILGERIKPTRQEVFFFGTPAGDSRFLEAQLPVWIDNGSRLMYGIPGNEWRGFKVADDTRGPAFDPTNGSRTATPDALNSVRAYLSMRFPALNDAPLVESRVCQYENTPDNRFILDHHPHAANVWFVGGGSGHGFKHGPAIGERAADLVLGARSVDPFFALSRFSPSR